MVSYTDQHKHDLPHLKNERLRQSFKH